MTGPIYFDYNATTPIAPEVFDAMEPFLRQHFGNPSSAHHFGHTTAAAVDIARGEVAALLGAHANEIVFTGGATESNNLAIRGVARALRRKGRHLITSAIEHPSVTAPFARLQEDGWDLTILPVDECGRTAPQDLAEAMRADTVLVSIMHANNEVGTIQPINELARIAHGGGALFHTDAAQSIGKISVNVDTLGADLLTMAGHKCYAPKGIGALYIRQGTPCEPVLVGAGQEQGRRPGTENVPYIVGLGRAASLAREHLPQASERLRRLCDYLYTSLQKAVPGIQLNGHANQRLPNTLNVSFPRVSGRQLLSIANGIAASTGSACHEEGRSVSGVLAAMGIGFDRAQGAIRLSLGHYTTQEQIEMAQQSLALAWQKLTTA